MIHPEKACPETRVPRGRILLVDDDPSIRLLCSTSLKNAGYVVLEAEGSTEAMRLYTESSEPVELLLTDLFLPPPDFQLSTTKTKYPRVNGHILVNQALSLKRELRVLLMSSHTIDSVTAQGIAIVPEQFLCKPFTVEQLLEKVAAALAGPPRRVDGPAASASIQAVRWFD